MAVRPIDATAMLAELKPITYEMEHTSVLISDMANIMRNWVERQPTLTPPPASSDLISRSALLMGETEPEIITGSDSELAEHMEWERWMDKIKRAPAVGKEAAP